MKYLKNILSKFTSTPVLWKSLPPLTRRSIILASTILAIAVGLITYSLLQDSHPETVVIKPVSNHKNTAKTDEKPQATSEPAPADEASNEPDEPATVTPTPSVKKIAPTPKPTAPAPQPLPVEFSLNVSEITLAIGSTSSVFQATSTNGQPLEWAVFGTATGVFLGSGLVSEGRTTVHNFSFSGNPYLSQPGTYQARVEGYIPGGQHVTKSITVNIIPAQP